MKCLHWFEGVVCCILRFDCFLLYMHRHTLTCTKYVLRSNPHHQCIRKHGSQLIALCRLHDFGMCQVRLEGAHAILTLEMCHCCESLVACHTECHLAETGLLGPSNLCKACEAHTVCPGCQSKHVWLHKWSGMPGCKP